MESKGEQGEKEREAEFITYSSGIPLDLPAFLLHLLLLRICFIYISYFSLVCPPSQFPWPPREAAIPRIRTGWPRDTNEIDRGEEGDLFSPFFFSLLPPQFQPSIPHPLPSHSPSVNIENLWKNILENQVMAPFWMSRIIRWNQSDNPLFCSINWTRRANV